MSTSTGSFYVSTSANLKAPPLICTHRHILSVAPPPKKKIWAPPLFCEHRNYSVSASTGRVGSTATGLFCMVDSEHSVWSTRRRRTTSTVWVKIFMCTGLQPSIYDTLARRRRRKWPNVAVLKLVVVLTWAPRPFPTSVNGRQRWLVVISDFFFGHLKYINI